MLIVETRDGICRLTMNRPERRNALGSESMALLLAALQAADIDSEVRVIVLTAAAPAFCAGSDLKELGGLSPEEMCRHEAATAAVVRYFAAMDKPIIAAVEGYALGGGFALAAACDVVVTSVSTRWHMPEVSNGWLPPWGLKALIARTGPHRARSLCWGLEALNGEQAVSIGLADVMCDPGHAEDTALTLAHKFVALPAESVTSCKRFYDPFLNADAEYLDRVASDYFASDCQGERAKTILAKFGEKK
ncbi:enoyl-CoA hydratase/isomerase family protein [Pantoea rwandensis]|uniref:Enoyl-CoA hydratase n=1 Tax=Pantoea rwandensis TaxID=1076550 RepID=A0A1X1D3F8_9GAMM|nr:enoyl-CoA hydratase/isomerase family protein [Pantoea rwandensis]ORM71222.1 enoyl-CoA hydratase [Pantoea rwandensis]